MKAQHILVLAILAAMFTLPASTAQAKGAGDAKPHVMPKGWKTKKAKKNTKPAPKKTKNYDFLADEIEASRIGPGDTTIFGIQNLSHKSLIRLRSDFIGEILKSAEML